jgi:cytochrome P450
MVEHTADYDKSSLQRNLFRPLVGKGLLTSEGQLHQQQRKLMAPAFQPRRLVSYADTMVDYAVKTRQDWAEGAVLDLDAEMMRLTMSVVSKVLLDIEISDVAATREIRAALEIGLRWIKYATTGLFPLPLFVPTPRNLQAQKALKLVRGRIQAMIDERRANLTDQGDLLSVLLLAQDEEGRGMSDRQVLDEAATIFLAGHETTAHALTWSFYLLTRHPEIYARMLAELDAVLGERIPTYNDLTHLPYTLQVLKEALRLYPPSSIIFRRALRATEIGDYPIPKGALVIFSQQVLHRRSDNFPDPERFDPERFTSENEARLHRHAYLPFGAGPRICIGNHFALMEGHLLMATLSQKVRLELLNDTPVEPELVVTLRPKSEIKVRVVCRS